MKGLHGLWLVGLLALPGLVIAQTPESSRAQTDTQALPPAVRMYDALPERANDEAFMTEFQWAHLQQQGVVPIDNTFRSLHAICDVNGDQVHDLMENDRQSVRIVSGGNGSELWRRENVFIPQNPIQQEFERKGREIPAQPDNAATVMDANGDGVCDVLAYSVDAITGIAVPILQTPTVGFFRTTIMLLDGKTGAQVWQREFGQTRQQLNLVPLLLNVAREYVIQGVATGFHPFMTPEGPRFILKTTDLEGGWVDNPFPPAVRLESTLITDHLVIGNAADGTTVWERDLLPDQAGRYTNYTWISGVGNVAGSETPEIILDQLLINNPRSDELRSPFTGQPVYEDATAMNVLALRGEDGLDVWNRLVFDETTLQTNLPIEENFQTLMWTHGELIGDVNGDAKPEVLASYVTREAGVPTSLNGGYLTHFKLLDGITGLPLWGENDAKIQGIGYASPLGESGDPKPLLGIGAVDVPTRPDRENVRFSRFPLKEVRIAALDLKDGTIAWQYKERFAQDTYLSFVLTVNQFIRALAPHDWNADGYRDFVTPARYQKLGATQTLYATQTHTYDILSGVDGTTLHTIRSWGANGFVLPCGDSSRLTVASGQARRMDLSRIDVANESAIWSRRIWMDPVLPRASTASVDMVGLSGVCTDNPDGSTFYAFNAEMRSMQRGRETLRLMGQVAVDGNRIWVRPILPNDKAIASYLDLTEQYGREGQSDIGLAAGLGAGTLLPGAGLGLAAGGFLNRRSRMILPFSMVLLVMIGAFVPAVSGGANPDLPIPTVAVPSEGPMEQAPAQRPDLTEALADVDLADTRALEEIVASYVRPTAPPETQAVPPLEPNASISYTYSLGDVDGDNVEDFALDTYCTEVFECGEVIEAGALGSSITSTTPVPCGPGHRLSVQSGRDGEELWSRDLMIPHPVRHLGCAQEYVIGPLPAPDRAAPILMYRFAFADVARFTFELVQARTIEHEFFALDPADGHILWTHTVRGNLVRHFNFFPDVHVGTAENFVVNPILYNPQESGVSLLPEGTQSALFLQGIGYRATYANSIVGVPGVGGPFQFLRSYQPQETLSRLDPAAGTLLWEQPSFQPSPDRSVKPQAPVYTYAEGPFQSPGGKVENYWNGLPCCFDLNGDKVPDPVFTTWEWTTTPTSNTAGPYFLDRNMIAFDGTNGARLWETNLAKDLKGHPVLDFRSQSFVYLHSFGDTDGDGASDVVVRFVSHEHAEYHSMLLVYSGRDGVEKWRIDNARNMTFWSIGDANGDGGNDILVIEWWDNPLYGQNVGFPVTNVTATPLMLHSGRDGSLLWTSRTVSAPLDIQVLFNQMRYNGIPDFDGDGVGDLVLDDPVFLPDLTVVHQQRIVSGRDAQALFSYVAAGVFAFPSPAGDVTGDGVDDFLLLSGDVIDLWLTLYDGAKQEALWSRRALAPQITNYAIADPRLRVMPLQTPNLNATRLLVDFQLLVETEITFFADLYTEIGTEPEVGQQNTQVVRLTFPHVALYRGPNGARPWVSPQMEDENLSLLLEGPTPASIVYAKAMAGQPLPAEPFVLSTVAAVGFGATSFLSGFGSGFFSGRRWLK